MRNKVDDFFSCHWKVLVLALQQVEGAVILKLLYKETKIQFMFLQSVFSCIMFISLFTFSKDLLTKFDMINSCSVCCYQTKFLPWRKTKFLWAEKNLISALFKIKHAVISNEQTSVYQQNKWDITKKTQGT